MVILVQMTTPSDPFAGICLDSHLLCCFRYIDVVFHPWVVGRACSGELTSYYQQRLLQLTIPFVEAETGVKL